MWACIYTGDEPILTNPYVMWIPLCSPPSPPWIQLEFKIRNQKSTDCHLIKMCVKQVGIKCFTSWELIHSAKNFAQNSGSQTREKTFKIAVI